MLPKVWLVIGYDYCDVEYTGVFSTEEKAAAEAHRNEFTCHIEEKVVDEDAT